MITQEILRNVANDIYNNPNAESIIAGGAPRDIDLGVSPKDIDVFIEVNNEQEERDYLWFMREEMGYYEVGRCEAEEYDRALNPILSVWDYRLDLGGVFGEEINRVPVQFIFLDKNRMPEENNIIKRVFNLFDINVCRIALKYDLDSDKTKIYKGVYYKEAIRERTVHETDTFYRNRGLSQQAKDNTKRRIQRIGRKLGWKASYNHVTTVDGRQNWDFRAVNQPQAIHRDAFAEVPVFNAMDEGFQIGGANDALDMTQVYRRVLNAPDQRRVYFNPQGTVVRNNGPFNWGWNTGAIGGN